MFTLLNFATVCCLLIPTAVWCETLEQYYAEAARELDAAKKVVWNTQKAMNIILFIGDGMSDTTITATRIFKGQRMGKSGVEGWLSFDQFPHVGRSKTWVENAAGAASAGTACSMLCGSKPQESTLCVKPYVQRTNCTAYNPGTDDLKSILYIAQDAGKRTGVVTNTRITHATPANAYANSADRNIEVDKKGNCQDVASQLINKGSKINVLMGGGRRNFLPTNVSDPEYSGSKGRRTDYLNLIDTWKLKHTDKSAYVWSRAQFDAVNAANTDYLLALFEPSHMKYEYERVKTNDEPSLVEMTAKAIDILSRGPNGYFLLVEGGRIDHAHHDGIGNAALLETAVFDDAIERALSMTNRKDTLIIVTADHGHAMIMPGYTERNISVMGINKPYYPEYKPIDGKASTVLMYIDGPGAQVNVSRKDPSLDNVTDYDYKQNALIPTDIDEGASHTGEDVNIYAIGPMAHMFHTTHEQHYIMHVMKYAACLDNYQNEGHCFEPAPPPPDVRVVVGIVVGLALVVIIGVIIGCIVYFRVGKSSRSTDFNTI